MSENNKISNKIKKLPENSGQDSAAKTDLADNVLDINTGNPSNFRQPTDFVTTDDNDDDDGATGSSGDDGTRRLKPDQDSEYEQRVARRQGEAQYGEHVKDARLPDDPELENELGMGMGSGLMSHPLLADMPEGADSISPMDRLNVAENEAAKIELIRKLENSKRAENVSTPSLTAR